MQQDYPASFYAIKKVNAQCLEETEKFQTDPNWKDNILFYEYFHGNNGAGLGASHQTGWTGVIAILMKFFAEVNSDWDLNLAHSGDITRTAPFLL